MIRQALFISAAVLVSVAAMGCGGGAGNANVVTPPPQTLPDAGPSLPDAGAPDAGNPGMNCPQAEPTPCSSQLDCPQNSGGPQMFTCLPSSQGNECTFEGEYSATCAVLQPMVQVNAQLNPTLAAGSQSLVLRVFYPQAVDGSAITCGSLAQDPMVGADSNLNAMVVQGINIPAQAQTVIGFPTTLLPLEGAVFYMEAWSGPLDLNTEMPTGTQLAVGCLDNQTIQSRAISIQQMSVMIGGN